MQGVFRKLIFLAAGAMVIACAKNKNALQFERLGSGQTNISFVNKLEITAGFDVFRYRNYYNGGGVSIGDINRDGLSDVFLTANMGPNKLYLNQGDLKFKDISKTAGIEGNREWSTGVVMADVNGDNLLDIYVCNSGDIKGGKRENELFINNGDLTFSEKGFEMGLADKGFSTHAAFFDYDQDGDLDCYVLNNSFRPVSSLGYENIRHLRDSTGGDKLYRNQDGYFEDVSAGAGIYGSVIGFGLGVTVTDVNQDGWMDIYVSNDFFERDYLYMNQKNGSFKDELTTRMDHISNFSMGTDAADLNNDGFPEIFVTDMLPKDEHRLKTMVNFETYDVHQIKIKNDYYEQYMRNTLQLNRGDGSFAEIGQYAGVHATDWSWGALIADFNNDLHKEIYVTNGIYKDVIDQDFINYLANEENMIAAMRAQTVDFKKLVDQMPSTMISNFLFQQKSDLQYQNVASEWGLDEPSFSNAAAYGDLDNDGDLDLIVNNVNQELFVYRNRASQKEKNYLKMSFKGPRGNTYGIGASVKVFTDGNKLLWENIPTKGFQASMDYQAVIGLDTLSTIDSLVVEWGYGKQQTIKEVSANQHLILNISDAEDKPAATETIEKPIFQPVQAKFNPPYQHQENRYVDFNQEPLIYHQLSREGPALAVADINNDGRDDLFLGGASGQAGIVYLQKEAGCFDQVKNEAFLDDYIHEDVDATFFDADGDGDLDLYVASGGYAFAENSLEYQDRLYLNSVDGNGKPVFMRASQNLPEFRTITSCVKPADFDQDGDLDLFVGTRVIPGQYGKSPSSYLLENDGSGNFMLANNRLALGFHNLGMVTDATWVDLDDDQDQDLVVVGEWMPVVIFKNNGVNLERLNNVPGLTNTEGWWRSIYPVDLNQDGNMDLVGGNFGLNSRYHTTTDQPFTMFLNDFDGNGVQESIFAYYHRDSLFPVALRHDMVGQMPSLKKKYLHYHDYAGQTLSQIFSREELENSYRNQVRQMASLAIINQGDGSYQVEELPAEVQWSPVFAIVNFDFDADGNQEIFLGGNFSGVKPEEGRYDANQGLILKYDNEDWQVLKSSRTGLRIKGDMKRAVVLRTGENTKYLLVARNNQQPIIYEFSTQPL